MTSGRRRRNGGKVLVAAPPGEEHGLGPDAAAGGDRVLALGLTGVAAPDDEGHRRSSPGERLDEQRHPLRRGEPSDVDQHHVVTLGAQEPVEVGFSIIDVDIPRVVRVKPEGALEVKELRRAESGVVRMGGVGTGRPSVAAPRART